MKRFTVRLREFSGGFDKTVRLLLPDIDFYSDKPTTDRDAVDPAIKKMFGKHHRWRPDSGMGFWCGVVSCPVNLKNNDRASYLVTDIARINVTEGWK